MPNVYMVASPACVKQLDVSRLVPVHGGAQLPSRRWPVERFASMAQALADEGWQIALTGSAGEAPLTAMLARMISGPSVDLAGATTLGGLAALVKQVQLIVCNDTGLSRRRCGENPQRGDRLRQRYRALGAAQP
jgi:ADP-heptose:LPS heptosyltransferase